MKITRELLKKYSACTSGYNWFIHQNETDHEKFIDLLMNDNHFDWANWLIVRLMNKKQKVQYAVFAAEQVIDIYEKKCPDDNRPRKAIEAAKKYIDNQTRANKDATVYTAADAYAAANAAYAAANAADAAAYTTAVYTAADAAYAAVNADSKLEEIIIKFGLELLK